MALNVGQVFATAGLNTKGFMTGIDAIHKEGIKTAGRIGKEFDQLGRRMQSIGKRMTMGLTLPLVGAGVLAVKTAADYEKLRVSMDVLNGSAEEGARNFERLKEFSARTPFQLKDLASAQNMLQGFGLAADDAFKSIKMIGDISAVSGGSIEGIGIAFGQAAAEGKLMSRDIRQLINQGVPAIKLLADTMGVAESEIFDLASQGKISFDILNKAFEEATSEGGMFADGMKKQAKTIGGVFSTLKDNVSLALGEIGTTLVEELDIKGMMESLTESIQGAVKWFSSLSPVMKKVTVAVVGFAAAAGPLVFVLGTWNRALGSILMMLPKVTAGQIALNRAMKANIILAVAGAVVTLTQMVISANKAVSDLNKELEAVSKMSIKGTEEEFFRVRDAIDGINKKIEDTKALHKSMGVTGTEAANKEIAALVKQRDHYFDLTAEINRKMNASTSASSQESAATDGATRAIEKQIDAYSRLRQAVSKPVDDIMPDLSFDKSELQGIHDNINQLTDIDFGFGEKFFPEGSLGALQGRLSELREQMLFAFDPEVQARLREEMMLTEEQIAAITGGAQKASKAGQQFGQMMGNALSQAVLHAKRFDDVLKNIVKQLAPQAITQFVMAVITGGSSLAAGSIGKSLFGGLFHTGGIVPGVGDKNIIVKGGEAVLTQGQMAALGNQQSRGGSVRIVLNNAMNLDGDTVFRNQRNIEYQLNA